MEKVRAHVEAHKGGTVTHIGVLYAPLAEIETELHAAGFGVQSRPLDAGRTYQVVVTPRGSR